MRSPLRGTDVRAATLQFSEPVQIKLFSRVRLGLNPEMNALATLFIAFVTVGVIAANYFMQRSERRRLTNVM